MSRSLALTISALLLAVTLAAEPHSADAASCSDVYDSLYPCLSYIQGGGNSEPTDSCCEGIKGIVSTARTTVARQSACNCLKSVASGVPRTYVKLAGGLPAKCGTSIPFKISPSTDCAKVK